VTNCPVFPGHVLFSFNNITIFYPYRGGITYFKCIEINNVFIMFLFLLFCSILVLYCIAIVLNFNLLGTADEN